MRNVDMLMTCLRCSYHQTIYYANGAIGCGCMAHDVNSTLPVDINKLECCPKGKDGKK